MQTLLFAPDPLLVIHIAQFLPYSALRKALTLSRFWHNTLWHYFLDFNVEFDKHKSYSERLNVLQWSVRYRMGHGDAAGEERGATVCDFIRRVLQLQAWRRDNLREKSPLQIHVDLHANDEKLLQLAAAQGNLAVMRFLLSLPETRRPCESGTEGDPAIAAATYGRHEILRLLLHDPRFESSFSNNETLQISVDRGHVECVRVLLEEADEHPAARDLFGSPYDDMHPPFYRIQRELERVDIRNDRDSLKTYGRMAILAMEHVKKRKLFSEQDIDQRWRNLAALCRRAGISTEDGSDIKGKTCILQ